MHTAVLAFDTSNEVIAIGVGRLDGARHAIELIAHEEVAAHRASNTQLVPRIDALFERVGLTVQDIACVAVGRGPGSFTGVRIAMATAKGIASALGVALVGLSTQNAIARAVWASGRRGSLLVASDAMRKEIYPARFVLDDAGVVRLTPDCVVRADEFAAEAAAAAGAEGAVAAATRAAADAVPRAEMVAGDALGKYADMLACAGEAVPEELWTPTGAGLLLELEALWRAGKASPTDARRHDPVAVLPIYTRLSDAEENERTRLADASARNLRTGVQGACDASEVDIRPFDAAYAASAAVIEDSVMGEDAWSAASIADELPRRDRTWWMAVRDGELVGYAGGMLVDGDMQLLKIAVVPEERRRGVARALLARVAEDAENLAATSMSLEVRASNEGARAFYEGAGFVCEGMRPRYYTGGEDAAIMHAALPLRLGRADDVAGAGQTACGTAEAVCGGVGPASEPCLGVGPALAHPLILAIESSCDETAAAVVDGEGRILSDIVASQIDFHARFGGVVPEIASRKHVEAIVGTTSAALEDAAAALGVPSFGWRDLDAVAVTYAPGLVGALVVGVAFAKGAAWAAGCPLIAVNHLEGHLYANKLAGRGAGAPAAAGASAVAGMPTDSGAPAGDDAPFGPPAVVSLVSGGNTMLVHMRDWQDYEILGSTIDDAVGEAFDKVAKALGLPYPGGPHISRLAAAGDPSAIDFPRALMHSGDYRFSLSGLKTAVATYIDKQRAAGEGLAVADICASFQQAVIDVQVSKAARALKETGAPTFCLGGGVAANPELRRAYEAMCAKRGVRVVMPPLSACGDNAAMIALVALDRYRGGCFAALDLDAQAHADLAEPY